MKTIGLARHAATAAGYESLGVLFRAVERVAGRGRRVKRLEAAAYRAGPERERETWLDFLQDCDAVVCDMVPALPPDYGSLLELREESGLDFAAVLLPLGGLTTGAEALRASLRFLRRGDLIAFSCTADRDAFHRYFSCVKASLEILPYEVDASRFKPPSARARGDARRELGLSPDEIALLYTGRLSAVKNLPSVLAVFKALLAERRNLRLIVAGGPHNEAAPAVWPIPGTGMDFLSRIEKRLWDRIVFLGPMERDDLPRLYGAADLYLNLTLNPFENFGVAPLEAAACGLPVVATDWGGIRDIVEPGRTGLLADALVTERGVRVDLWQAFKHCERLIGSSAARAEMGRRGIGRARRSFSPAEFERRFEGILAAALSGRARGGRTNRFTRAGSAFHAAFRDRQGRPVVPEYAPATRRLAQWAIEPYATRRARTSGRGLGRIFSASPLFRVDGLGARSRDPLWPGGEPLSSASRAVLSALVGAARRGRPFLTPAQLRAGLPEAVRARFSAALRPLLRNGWAVMSAE